MPFHSRGSLVVSASAAITTMPNPELLPGQSWSRWSGNMFEAEPKSSDIKQGAISDCWLLAGLNAILVKGDGPALMQSFVCDRGDHVIFRLYKEGALHHVRVEKSLASDGLGRPTRHNIGARWVQLFEKVFAGFILTGGYPRLARGGDALAAAQALIGGQNFDSPMDTNGELLRSLVFLSPENSSMFNWDARRSGAYKDKLKTGFRLTDVQLDEWSAWNKDATFKLLKESVTAPYSIRFDQVIEKEGGALTCKALLVTWYRTNHPIPGAIGTGVYTAAQTNFFMRIQRAIATQHMVTVETRNELVGRIAGRGHSGGEAKVLGLVSSHAYSVVDTKVEGRLRYLQLRNPWGAYHREYETAADGSLKPKEIKSGADSWLELTDFFLNFQERFVDGGPVHAAPRQALMTGLAGQLTAQRDRLTPVGRERSGAVAPSRGRSGAVVRPPARP